MKILFSNKKIMKKILLSFVASVIVGTAMVLFALFFVRMQIATYFLKIFETKTMSQLQIYHENQKMNMQDDLQHTMDIVTNLSQYPSVRSALLSGNISGALSQMEQQRKINQHLQILSVFDKTGRVVALSTDMPGFQAMMGADLSDRDYFKQVMATKKPYMSPVLTGILTNNLFIDFSVPVFDDKYKIAYVLNGSSPIKDLRTVFEFKNNVADYYNVVTDKIGNVILDNGNIPQSMINIRESDRIVNSLFQSSNSITDEEINYKGDKVFAMGDVIQISGNTDNRLYLISYFPKSQFDKQTAGLEAEIDRIFFGIEVITLLIIAAMWTLNYWLAVQYINERGKIIEITK